MTDSNRDSDATTLDKIRSEAGRSHEFGWSSQTPTFLQPRHLQSPEPVCFISDMKSNIPYGPHFI